MQRCGDSSQPLFGPVLLPLVSQPHSTTLPSPKRYEGKVMKQSPRSFPSPQWLVGTQPHRHMRRLHRLPHHTYQVVIEGFQVCLVSEFDGEGFEGLPRIVLPSIEASVYEGLDAATE